MTGDPHEVRLMPQEVRRRRGAGGVANVAGGRGQQRLVSDCEERPYMFGG